MTKERNNFRLAFVPVQTGSHQSRKWKHDASDKSCSTLSIICLFVYLSLVLFIHLLLSFFVVVEFFSQKAKASNKQKVNGKRRRRRRKSNKKKK